MTDREGRHDEPFRAATERPDPDSDDAECGCGAIGVGKHTNAEHYGAATERPDPTLTDRREAWIAGYYVGRADREERRGVVDVGKLADLYAPAATERPDPRFIEAADRIRATLESESYRYHKDHGHPNGIGNCTHKQCQAVRKARAAYDRARPLAENPDHVHDFRGDPPHCTFPGCRAATERPRTEPLDVLAALIEAHEPVVEGGNIVECRCGWWSATESWSHHVAVTVESSRLSPPAATQEGES